MTARLGAGVALVALCASLLGLVALDAAARRRDARSARAARVALSASLGLPDLALSSGSRWLRHPSQVEPAAALADAPFALDADPAGAWIAPPRAVFRRTPHPRLEVRR